MVARFWKSRDMKGMQDIYQKATAGNLVVGACLFLILWVNLDTFFDFMAPEYRAGRYVFLLLGAGKLFDMASGLNATILATSGKYRYDLLFTVLMAGVAIGANILFIPKWGIEGAALASMLTMLLFNMLRIAFIQHHFQIQPFGRKQIWVPVIMIAVMALSEAVAPLAHVLIDLPVRSFAAAGLLLMPVRLLRISPELNQWTDNLLIQLKHRLRKI